LSAASLCATFALALASVPAHAGRDDAADFKLSSLQFAPTASAFNASLTSDATKFETTAIATLDKSRSENVVRLESAWLSANEDSKRQLRLGDSTSNPGSWGSAVRFAGLQFGTRTAMRADILDAPRLALAGLAIVPSTSDAMLTAHKVPQTNIAQRGLSVASKTGFAGSNVSVTTRDANGRSNTFTQPLVPKFARAETGCNQYSMSVGRARQDYALASNSYGPWFANTTVTCGTDLGLAIEAHGEYLQGENGLAGVNLTQPIGVLGTAALAVATSDNDKGSGWLVRMGLQHTTDRFEFNVRTRRQTPAFRELGEGLDAGSISQRTLASIGAKLSDRNMFALAYTNQTSYEGQRVDYVGMSQVIELGYHGKVSIMANRAINETEDASVNVSYLRKLKK
ncbi:MAG TPA: hypothetical protein VK629_12580, partial [Steroidobacteraceae bacterium]|nr:hypothetical protein [Steroidobacteraceae bacterium]